MARSAGEARVGSGLYPPDGIRTVGVVGGGSAGLLAALALARSSRGLKVTLIESPTIPAIGVGESTTPALARFLHHRLRIDPATLMSAVRPTWKLGIQFHWGAADRSFPFPFAGDDVLDAWVFDGHGQRQSNGSAWMAAGKGPVSREQDDLSSHVAATNHAYHLDNRALLAALKQWASGRVEMVSASITAVDRRADGSIERLRTGDGRALAYDLYVDCSGFRSLLLGGALGVSFLSYARSLCTDRAIHGVVRTGATGPPYTEARTMAAGWRWTIPLRGEDHLGYVFASAFLSEADAERELRASAPGIEDLALVRFRSGRHRDFLAHNVVALGNAYGFVEPLESTALHMLAFQIEALLDGWPFGEGREPAQRLLNDQVGRAWDGVRAFLAVHYRFNRRLDTPLWRWARAECDLVGNEEILAHFADCAPLSMRADRQLLERALFRAPGFGPFAYDCLLLGQGVPTRLLGPRRDRDTWEAIAREREQLIERSLPHGEALEAHEAPALAPDVNPRYPALAIEGATSHLRLRRGAEMVTLRVFIDSQRARRVYRRAGELGISHVEPAIPAALVPAAAMLCSALERGEELAQVFPSMDGTVLDVLRATFDDQRLPHWPASMRTGPPGAGPWPYDAELAGVVLGLRRLIRREWLASDVSRAVDERWLASHGLRHRAVPAADGRVVVLASRDAGTLAVALELEPLVERPSPRWEQAAAQMGEMLGYPQCCIATFVAARARDDGSLFAERLPPPRHAPLPPETLWLDAALALVSHAPCDPSCPATLALGTAIRATLGDGAASWAGLATRLHAITRSGRVLAIAGSGTLAGGLDVSDAIQIVPSGATPELRAVPVAPRLTLDGWMLEGLGEPCTLFSDHRGARSEVASLRSAPSIAGVVPGSPSTR